MRQKVKTLAKFIFALCTLIACSKTPIENGQAQEDDPIINVVTVEEGEFTYTSAYYYNLNLVYFIPQDFPEIPDYHRRISEYMLHMRAFTSQWMQHWGYGNKTFGLLTDQEKERVRVTIIRGSQNKADYPYEGGGNTIRAEVDAYYNQHPDQKTSDHYFILMPDNLDAPTSPFYGMGRYAYALDAAELEVSNLGQPGQVGAHAQWIGGLFHELGHGLNLPHSKGQESEANNPQFGMELMSAGNGTYGSSPTYLSAFSCAILNSSQLFSKAAKPFYTPVNAKINRIRAQYTNGNIVLSGKFTSDVPVNDILLRHIRVEQDPGGYQAENARVQLIGQDSFYYSMPITELKHRDTSSYQLETFLVHDNGALSKFGYAYKFENGIPQFHFQSSKDEYSKTDWTIHALSSEETTGEGAQNGRAIHLIDDDVNTLWHSKWTGGGASAPHFVAVDMASAKPVKGFSFVQRTGSSKSKEVEILTSNDGNTWESTLTFNLANNTFFQYFDLPTEKTFQYFKVVAHSSYEPNPQYATIAEVGVYK